MHPQLNEKSKIEANKIIQIAIGNSVIEEKIPYNETKYFTIDDIMEKSNEKKANKMDVDPITHGESVNKRYGVWSTVDGNFIF